ncbi:PAS domain S-box protein [Telmatobacter bradus]|uniref:PAS domain-containing protein n=1 Tax=Telmatobacter bradus TaxID=474953 RepID=UPI003B42FD4C
MKYATDLSESLFDSVPIPLLLVDAAGKVVRANPAECKLLGYSVEEMQGRPMWEFIANEEEQLSQQRFRDVLEGLELTTSYRRCFKTKDNDYLICELYVQVVPYSAENGPFVLAASINVTRQVVEARCRGEVARWLEAAFRSLPEATVILDTLGRIRYLNHAAEQLLGWSQVEASGEIAEDLIPWRDVLSSDGTQSDYELQRGISLGWSGSATIIAREGTAKRLQIRTEPVVDSNGLVLGIANCLTPL